MGYRAMTALGVAALMLAGAPMYTRAESTSETPSATEKMEQKAEQLGGKAKRTAKEAKGDVTDAWVTAKAKIARFTAPILPAARNFRARPGSNLI